MNIVHIGLAAYYTEGMTYQDNLLSEFNARDGHTTTYISNAQCWENGKIVDVDPCDRILGNGVRLIRMRYRSLGLRLITEKIRVVSGLYRLLESLKPDVILSHDLCYWSVLDVIRYKKEHSEVVLYADTHTDYKNSGRNWLSLNVLHKVIYKSLIKKALPHIKKYFYVTKERKRFSTEVYGMPESIMEFYPLGGNLLTPREKAESRSRIRSELMLSGDEIFLLHTGKLDVLKRTDELLRAFSRVTSSKLRLFLIGSIDDSYAPIINSYIKNDARIHFLGWRNGEALLEYLAACDMYLQPGSQSASLENALCCGTPIMIYPHESYDEDYLHDNGFYVKSLEDIITVFLKLEADSVDLEKMSVASFELANKYFNYRSLAARLYC